MLCVHKKLHGKHTFPTLRKHISQDPSHPSLYVPAGPCRSPQVCAYLRARLLTDLLARLLGYVLTYCPIDYMIQCLYVSHDIFASMDASAKFAYASCFFVRSRIAIMFGTCWLPPFDGRASPSRHRFTSSDTCIYVYVCRHTRCMYMCVLDTWIYADMQTYVYAMQVHMHTYIHDR